MKRDDKEPERECQARELTLSPGGAAVSSPAVSMFSAPVFSGVVHCCGSLPRAFCPSSIQQITYRRPWEIRAKLGMSSSMLSREKGTFGRL